MRITLWCLAAVACIGCKTTSDRGAGTLASSEDGVRPLPTGIELVASDLQTEPETSRLPASGFSYSADELDCSFGTTDAGEKICRPKKPALESFCFKGDMMKACALIGALSDRSKAAYTSGAHDLTVLTACKLMPGGNVASIELNMTTDYPEYNNEEAEIRDESVVPLCGEIATGGAKIYGRSVSGTLSESTRMPDSGFGYNAGQLNCDNNVCTPKTEPMQNICFKGDVQSVCVAFKRLSDRSESDYTNGDHDRVYMTSCKVAGANVALAYSMGTDYTDYAINAKATIEPCP